MEKINLDEAFSWTIVLPNGQKLVGKFTSQEQAAMDGMPRPTVEGALAAERMRHGYFTQLAVRVAVEQAIKDERERCAMIAQHHTIVGDDEDEIYQEGARVARRIADEIRSGT